MIFSEIYGSYYKAITEILKIAVSESGSASLKDIRPVIEKYAFAESLLAIEPAISEERWQVVRADGETAIENVPSRPLTLLERRWLKAMSLDPRIKLFDVDFSWLDDVEPLFTQDDYYIFDKYDDGDPFGDPEYIKNFRLILGALKEHQPLRISIENRRGSMTNLCVIPEYLEYSEKDDKFRLITSGTRHTVIVNLGRIIYCRRFNGGFPNQGGRKRNTNRSVTLILTDKRNALERVLLHFSHFEKQAERIDEEHYKLIVKYDKDDETELVIRILSFGPMVKVIEPYSFVDLIKKRLMMQKGCGL